MPKISSIFNSIDDVYFAPGAPADSVVATWRKEHEDSSSATTSPTLYGDYWNEYDAQWSPYSQGHTPVVVVNPGPDFGTQGTFAGDRDGDRRSRSPRTPTECGDVSVLLEGRNGATNDCFAYLSRGIQARFKVDVEKRDCDGNDETVLCVEVPRNIARDECVYFAQEADRILDEDLPESCKVAVRRYKTISRRRGDSDEGI